MAVVVPLVLSAWACGDTLNAQPCRGIPEGGCPLSHGLACDDPTCVAAYACTPGGAWVFDHPCPGHGDAGGDASTADVRDARSEAYVPRDANIDVPGANGGPGCPDLQPPDCPLGLALACGSASCCDCIDLFVCTNGGWNLWGTCDNGALAERDH